MRPFFTIPSAFSHADDLIFKFHGIIYKIIFPLFFVLAIYCTAEAAVWDDSDFSYNSGPWPTLHHDVHNSDHMPASIGSFTSLTDLSEIAWVLREKGHPSVVLTVEALGTYAERDMFFITTGKTAEPNLHAYDMEDGSEIWHAAPPTADDPGPGACAMTSMPLLDEDGNLFISDCQYLFRYDATAAPDKDGVLQYDWRIPMPGLRQYDKTDGLWKPSSDPGLSDTRAKPFITLFFTRKVEGKAYIGGISTEGGIYILDPEDGTLYAQACIDDEVDQEALDWTPDGPCVVEDYVAKDDPMYYDITEGAEDGFTPFGIWSTGVIPETDDPDADYFMDPCQLSGYFNANTAGGGGMVINTPAVTPDPEDSAMSRIYVNGSQSALLSSFDITPTGEDAILYRIDFDPSAPMADRLTVLNNKRGNDGRFQYRGRMPNGENSLSSPTVSPNEKWLISGDNQGNFYNFSAENGDMIWMEEIGSLLGSPTVVQRIEADGLVYIHTFGNSKLWTFVCDPESGEVIRKKKVDFRQYILRNYWRADDPGYGHHFVNQYGNAYEREAVGASIAVATDDKMVLAYTVGWHDPDRPAAFLIPSHSVLLVVDRLSLLMDVPLAAMVDAGYIDKKGTMEQASLIATTRNGLRILTAYGSQSTTFARFMEVNDKMPEAMKSLYMKPYGGVRISEPVFAQAPALTPDPSSDQPAGTSIRWTAAFPGGIVADYRFSAGLSDEDLLVLKDFNPSRNFVWTPLIEGEYTIRVTARNRETFADMGSVDAKFKIASPVPEGKTQSVMETDNPVVALFSHAPCLSTTRMRVDFKPQGSDDEFACTGYTPCSPDQGANVYVAGLKAGVQYELRPVFVSQGVETYGETLLYTPADSGLVFPEIQCLLPDEGTTPAEKFLFMAGFPASPSNPLPIATNLKGDVVWYYTHFQDESAVATSPTPEGTFLLIIADNDVQGQRLREIDLAGNVVREVTIDRINEQLVAMGHDEAGAFDHEAVRFPDGNTLAQVSVEAYMPGVQPDVDNIAGSMIIALDQDWQVIWVWNSFDHMDVNRAAVQGEVCVSTSDFTFPGCPPLFKSLRAADWIHGNHIAPSSADGHLIYSMRNQDWVVKIDYAYGTGNGQVIWRLGPDGDFSALAGEEYPWFSHQHGAVFLSENNIIVLDNGNARCAGGDDYCHSRGQMIALDETERTAEFKFSADLGVYSPALGNTQRLSDGSFSFTAGLLMDGAAPEGQVIGIGTVGEQRFILKAAMNIYRAYRMKNLYALSWNGFTRCGAVLSGDFSLKVPIIDIGGSFIYADMVMELRGEDLFFRLRSFNFLDKFSEYRACDASHIISDGGNWRLILPEISYGLDQYRAEMMLMGCYNGELCFKLTEVSPL